MNAVIRQLQDLVEQTAALVDQAAAHVAEQQERERAAYQRGYDDGARARIDSWLSRRDCQFQDYVFEGDDDDSR